MRHVSLFAISMIFIFACEGGRFDSEGANSSSKDSDISSPTENSEISENDHGSKPLEASEESIDNEWIEKNEDYVMQSCGTGKNKEVIKITSSEVSWELSQQTSFYAHLSGNQSTLNLNLKASESLDEQYSICLFMTGNQSKLNLNIQADVHLVKIIATGNKPRSMITIQEGYTLSKLDLDFRGHDPDITMEGDIQEIVETHYLTH